MVAEDGINEAGAVGAAETWDRQRFVLRPSPSQMMFIGSTSVMKKLQAPERSGPVRGAMATGSKGRLC